MTLDRLRPIGQPVFDGLHHCHRCGDNVRDLTPAHLCHYCDALPKYSPPPRFGSTEGDRHVRAA